jgi:hypothetical protein
MNITECEGYKKLLAAVETDEIKAPKFHDYRAKLAWVLERANRYAEKTGLEASAILNAWEKQRSYWYMNYYQDSNQPIPDAARVRVFDTSEALQESIGADHGFRCPNCDGVSTSPYECNSGLKMKNGEICDWKVYGLFKDLGRGMYVYVISMMRGETIFMPIAWEGE